METTVNPNSLNETQWFILNTFLAAKSEQEKDELNSLYLDYIQKKLDDATNKWWQENDMTNEKLKEILNTHCRTPYKQ